MVADSYKTDSKRRYIVDFRAPMDPCRVHGALLVRSLTPELAPGGPSPADPWSHPECEQPEPPNIFVNFVSNILEI